MDRRFHDRLRSVNRERARRRVSVAVILLVLLLGVTSFLWLRSSSVFAVRTVTVTATQHVTREQISRVTSAVLGKSLLRLSTRSVEEALVTLPYVRSAEVHRSFPNTLDIRLEEYEASARLQTGNGAILILADNGRVLESVNGSEAAELPLIVSSDSVSPAVGGQVPAEILAAIPIALLLRTEQLGRILHVDHISVSSMGGLAVMLTGGTELRLGDPSKLEQKLTVAAAVMEQCLRDGEQPEYIDVSVPDRVAVKGK